MVTDHLLPPAGGHRPHAHGRGHAPESHDVAPPQKAPDPGAGRVAGAVADQRLVGPGGPDQPRGDVDRAAVPISLVQYGGPGVGADPHRQQARVGAHLGERALGERDGAGGVGHADHRAVAHRLHVPRAVLVAERAHHPAELAGHPHRGLVAVLLGERSVPHEVGEQERRRRMAGEDAMPARRTRAPAPLNQRPRQAPREDGENVPAHASAVPRAMRAGLSSTSSV